MAVGAVQCVVSSGMVSGTVIVHGTSRCEADLAAFGEELPESGSTALHARFHADVGRRSAAAPSRPGWRPQPHTVRVDLRVRPHPAHPQQEFVRRLAMRIAERRVRAGARYRLTLDLAAAPDGATKMCDNHANLPRYDRSPVPGAGCRHLCSRGRHHPPVVNDPTPDSRITRRPGRRHDAAHGAWRGVHRRPRGDTSRWHSRRQRARGCPLRGWACMPAP